MLIVRVERNSLNPRPLRASVPLATSTEIRNLCSCVNNQPKYSLSTHKRLLINETYQTLHLKYFELPLVQTRRPFFSCKCTTTSAKRPVVERDSVIHCVNNK